MTNYPPIYRLSLKSWKMLFPLNCSHLHLSNDWFDYISVLFLLALSMTSYFRVSQATSPYYLTLAQLLILSVISSYSCNSQRLVSQRLRSPDSVIVCYLTDRQYYCTSPCTIINLSLSSSIRVFHRALFSAQY